MVLTLRGLHRALLAERCRRLAIADRHAWRLAEARQRWLKRLLLQEWRHVMQVVLFLYYIKTKPPAQHGISEKGEIIQPQPHGEKKEVEIILWASRLTSLSRMGAAWAAQRRW